MARTAVDQLHPLGEQALRQAQARGDYLMGITPESTEVAASCGWDGAAAMVVLGAEACLRLAEAFARAQDSEAAAWLRRGGEPGRARVLFVTTHETLLITYEEDDVQIDYRSRADWEPWFFDQLPRPS